MPARASTCRWKKEGFLIETLIVDAEGKVTIPSEVLHKRGLRPGDAVDLVESAEGLFVYHGWIAPLTFAW